MMKADQMIIITSNWSKSILNNIKINNIISEFEQVQTNSYLSPAQVFRTTLESLTPRMVPW